MADELVVGKVEFQHYNYSPESIHQYFKERRALELKKIREVLEMFKIDESVINGILTELKKI